MDNNEKRMERPAGGPPMGGGPGGPGGRMAGAEKPKDFIGSMKKIFSYSKGHSRLVLIALIFAITSSILSLIGPSQLAKITDLIIDGMASTIDISAVAKIGTMLAIIYGASLIFNYSQGAILVTVSQKISKDLRTDLIQKINKLPLAYFDKTSYGDTLSRVTNDIDTIGTSLSQSLSTMASGIFTFLGALILMFATNWIMAISGLLATMIGFALAMFFIKKSQGYFKNQQFMLGKVNAHVEENYTGHTVVKAYGGEQFAKTKFDESNSKLQNAAWKAQYISGLMMPVMSFVGNFAYVIVCIVGGVLAFSGSISFAIIVAFMIYIRLFTQPLTQMAQAMTTLQSAAAASERVFGILEEEELVKDDEDAVEIKNVKGDVQFKDVFFGYNPNKIIIHDFSAQIKAGQKVAIVGPTGAGKTTLVNLLMRFYDTNSGEILLDGVPIGKIKRESIHNMFAMVLQDTWMFEGTILENIIYSEQNVTKEQVVEACKAVGIHHTIMTMPHGYETFMENAELSAGEKQLLTIARAMVKSAELLILDEATSSVDTRTELLIAKAMDNLSNGKTSFIIAHRLSTIKNADLILVMKDGNVIESGNHDALIGENGFYAELYNSQFEN
ncbi:MAG: ABC transporter ATP-binding protein [Bacillota bacterium]